MKLLPILGCLGAAMLMPLAAQSAPAPTATTATAPSTTPPPAPAPKPLLFHPPTDASGGVLPLRVGGGSRGASDDGVSLETLVPDQVALTTQAQPSLYWYQSKEAATQCEVTLTESKNPKPLLKLTSPQPTPAGIHALRLSKFKVDLKPNVLYRWTVAVVVDPANRSQDIIANGVIKRITPPADLAGKLDKATPAEKASLYAENGIWYDSLQTISDEIDHAPADVALRQQRDDLLKQVGVDGMKMETKLSKSP